MISPAPISCKIISALLFFLSGISASSGQVSVGIKGGCNLSTTIVGQHTNYFRFVYYGGFYSRIDISKKIFLSPEVYYSKKGNKLGPTFANGGAHNLHYLSAPVLLGFHASKNISILLGPEFSSQGHGGWFKMFLIHALASCLTKKK